MSSSDSLQRCAPAIVVVVVYTLLPLSTLYFCSLFSIAVLYSLLATIAVVYTLLLLSNLYICCLFSIAFIYTLMLMSTHCHSQADCSIYFRRVRSSDALQRCTPVMRTSDVLQ